MDLNFFDFLTLKPEFLRILQSKNFKTLKLINIFEPKNSHLFENSKNSLEFEKFESKKNCMLTTLLLLFMSRVVPTSDQFPK